MRTLTVHIPGRAAPQGSKRHVGNGVMVESSKRLRPWRAVACIATENAVHQERWERVEGPVSVEVVFAFEQPKSAPKLRAWHPTTRSSGDIDKLCRALLDSLTTAGVFRDDSQVTWLVAHKIAHEQPHTHVVITDLLSMET